MIKFLFSLVIIGGATFWVYENRETLDSYFDSKPEKPKISKKQQELNRNKRNPYFNEDNYGVGKR